MKIALMTLLMFSVVSSAHARIVFDPSRQSLARIQGATTEMILSRQEVSLAVSIDETKVKFSRADYSMPVVKILVPDLAIPTILDHRNTGEGAPCLAAYEAMSPEEVIQGRPGQEMVSFVITLSKVAIPESTERGKVCSVYMIERVEAIIRGVKFEHERDLKIGTRNIADCR